jgi:Fe-S-cluster containining protein
MSTPSLLEAVKKFNQDDASDKFIESAMGLLEALTASQQPSTSIESEIKFTLQQNISAFSPPQIFTFICGIIHKLHAQLDQEAQQVLMRTKTSCERGCAHCCYLLSSSSYPEGFLIAETLLRENVWKAYLPSLCKAARAVSASGMTSEHYFDQQHPCPFLTKNKDCFIYAIRPACCRYHYVISKPVLCSFDNKEAPRALVNLHRLELPLYLFAVTLSKSLRKAFPKIDDLPMGAPIPLMVLHCLSYLLPHSEFKDEPECKQLEKALQNLPSPLTWGRSYIFLKSTWGLK